MKKINNKTLALIYGDFTVAVYSKQLEIINSFF